MERLERGGSLQSILRDLVDLIGFLKFKRYFETMGVNRVHIFLESKEIECADDLINLDDLEARHLLDQIIMKTGLDHMRFHELQESLGLEEQHTDGRIYMPDVPACVPED